MKMIRALRKFNHFFLLFLFSIFFLFFLFSTGKLSNKELPKERPWQGKTHQTVNFYNKELFYQGVLKESGGSRLFTKHPVGGLVPHDLFASPLIGAFFQRLDPRLIKRIILIGPNHFEKGDFKVLSSLYGWETPFGIVEPDTEYVNELIKNKLAKIDEEVLSGEHSVGNLMPYIKFYLPRAKITPLILSHRLTKDDVLILAKNLKGMKDVDTLVLASVDFSHYLTSLQAKEKDKVTEQVLKEKNYDKLFGLNSDYLDSPATLATVLMMTREGKELEDFEILGHTNSGEMQKNGNIETTSYFTIVFYK